jgi:hypothetical protein
MEARCGEGADMGRSVAAPLRRNGRGKTRESEWDKSQAGVPLPWQDAVLREDPHAEKTPHKTVGGVNPPLQFSRNGERQEHRQEGLCDAERRSHTAERPTPKTAG